MTTTHEEVCNKIRRSVNAEFVEMENDFDTTRKLRSVITDKIMTAVNGINLTDEDGRLKDETDSEKNILTLALKALSDTEKAKQMAIALKLKNQEVEVASSAAARDRIAVVIKATAPGKLEGDFPAEALEEQLAAMFDESIKDFELKSNPKDLNTD